METPAVDSPEIHPVHAHGAHGGWWNYVVGAAALVVSIVSLVIAMHHGHTMEKLVAASTFPSVEVGMFVDDGRAPGSAQFALKVSNSGVGPARVESLEVWLDGRPIANARGFVDALKARAGATPFSARLTAAGITGTIVGAGREQTVTALEVANGAAWVQAMIDVAGAVRRRVCFCSVLDECFVSDDRRPRSRPQPVEHCPAVGVAYDDDAVRALAGSPAAPAR